MNGMTMFRAMARVGPRSLQGPICARGNSLPISAVYMRMITSKHTPEVAAQVPPASTKGTSIPASSLPTSGMSPRSPQELPNSTTRPVGQVTGIPHVTASEANSARPQRSSKHRLVYSEIFGPMAWVLAYSTATYFALALVWNLLARSEERSGQSRQISTLQRQIRATVGTKEI